MCTHVYTHVPANEAAITCNHHTVPCCFLALYALFDNKSEVLLFLHTKCILHEFVCICVCMYMYIYASCAISLCWRRWYISHIPPIYWWCISHIHHFANRRFSSLIPDETSPDPLGLWNFTWQVPKGLSLRNFTAAEKSGTSPFLTTSR